MPDVLIVDDDAMFRELLAERLRTDGLKVRLAQNGSEALEIIVSERPNAIVLDVSMPGMDGLATLHSIRGTPSIADTPVLILTGKGSRQNVIEAAHLGVAGFILKTSGAFSDLRSRLRAMLASVPLAEPQQSEPGRTSPDADGASGEPAAGRIEAPLCTREEVIQMVSRSRQIRAISPVAATVVKLTSNPRCDIEDVSRAITSDPAVALKILRLANSPIFNRGEVITTVTKAVVHIGLSEIRNAVMNLSVVDNLAQAASSTSIHPGLFWEHSIATAALAAEFARRVEPDAAPTAFMTGVLHDVGKLILMDCLGEKYELVLAEADRLGMPLHTVERRLLGTTHAEIMEQVLSLWKFAADFSEPIIHHHDSIEALSRLDAQSRRQCARLMLANRFVHALLIGQSGNELIEETEDLCELLHFDADDIRASIDTAQQHADEVKLWLLSNTSNGPLEPYRASIQRRIGRTYQIQFMTSSPNRDALGVFLDQISAARSEAPPDLVVIHARSTDEMAELEGRMQRLSGIWGTAPRPLVICQPDRLRTSLETRPQLSEARRLHLPATIGQLLEVVALSASAA